MAQIITSLAQLKGRIGNNVFKERLGKQYVSAAPIVYTKSNTPAAVRGRHNFAFFSRLSHAINNNFVLNSFWREIKVPGLTTQNIIQKAITPEVVNYNLSGFTLAHCEKPFTITLKEVLRQNSGIEVYLMPLGDGEQISGEGYPGISAQGFVFLYDPEQENKNQFTFLPVSTIDQPTNNTDELCFIFQLSGKHLKIIDSTQVKCLLFNLAVKDKDAMPVRCSNTICVDLQP